MVVCKCVCLLIVDMSSGLNLVKNNLLKMHCILKLKISYHLMLELKGSMVKFFPAVEEVELNLSVL